MWYDQLLSALQSPRFWLCAGCFAAALTSHRLEQLLRVLLRLSPLKSPAPPSTSLTLPPHCPLAPDCPVYQIVFRTLNDGQEQPPPDNTMVPPIGTNTDPQVIDTPPTDHPQSPSAARES